ncbi:MAG: hypothetical protein K2O89_00025 [Clostridia bacterium]|nr:hypothetical protein [Clostridia bacterium]
MQLLLILALLMYGGKSGSKNIIEEVKPVLETFGGEEIKEALKSAEEISGMLTAVKGLAGSGLFGSGKEGEAQPAAQGFAGNDFAGNKPDEFFPLAPIAAIADKEITYSLSKYISTAN